MGFKGSGLAPTCTLLLAALTSLAGLRAQAPDVKAPVAGDGNLVLSTISVGPHRFIAAHGRRALISGYASQGLDVWAYPFQILGNYRVRFREVGTTSEVKGEDILSRIDYQPGWIDRIYLGPDFVVRERLFVPLDLPGAILTYSVESSKPIEIDVKARPVLNLMWPGAIGGQSAGWNQSLDAYVLSEPLYGYLSTVGSPDIVAHDPIINRASQGAEGSDIAFTLRTSSDGTANVFMLLIPPRTANPVALNNSLIRKREALLSEADVHYAQLQQDVLQLKSPDERVNQAFAWAETALDQAWVCNSDLGCGYVAGYGPVRASRRPQYDWFFAGDGMVNADAAIAEGDWTHARQELEFILRYQDKNTGMIWHELSQSAGLINWAGKYPYMFVHVDTTFQFLASVDEYVQATGDLKFATEHWPQLQSAYRYCLSVIDPETSLPRIPVDKEGANEQDREQDDLALSVSWVSAASGFASLATATGHPDLAKEAAQAEQKARAAISSRYWDANEGFWISGHTASGHAMSALRSGPSEAIDFHLFSDAQTQQLLDRLASSSFQTSWGTRGVALGSSGFDPESYASGSVWPVGTGSMADTFWRSRRPVTALAIWESMIPLSFLDSMGHIHEALAGTIYRPQTESVTEQTWSSSAFISSTVHGLLGMSLDAFSNHLVFAPRLPSAWRDLELSHVRLRDGYASFDLHRSSDGISMKIENSGPAFHLEFEPDLPLGASYAGALLNGRAVQGRLQSTAQETSVRVVFNVPHGGSDLRIQTSGGVSLLQDIPEVKLGDPDTMPHIIGVHLDNYLLSLDLDIPAGRTSQLILQTPWKTEKADGVTIRRIDQSHVELSVTTTQPAHSRYNRIHATIQMAP
jgi:glycogen debranching enzyme